VGPKGHTVVIEPGQVGQADDLEAARVGQERAVPGHESVKPTGSPDQFHAGTEAQVVGVRQQDTCTGAREFIRYESLHGCLRSHGHEDGSLNGSVRDHERACPSAPIARVDPHIAIVELPWFRSGGTMPRHDEPAWRESMRVRFDFNNAMSAAVGAQGLDDREISRLDASIRQAHATLARRRRAGELEWMDLARATDVVREILDFVESIDGRFENFVVLGIGGSALGNTALSTALNAPYHNLLTLTQRVGKPRLFVLDNVDPDQFRGFLRVIDPEKTLFNVITKSGGTSETMAQYLIVRQLLIEQLGDRHREHIVATTDPKSGELRRIVDDEGYRSFPIPPGVGGRFSVLSTVGLLSAAATGIDIDALLAGARYADEICGEPDVWRNPAAMNATIHYLGYGAGRTLSVMMPYGQALKDVADWYCQLWAESLGKRVNLDGEVVYNGPTPIKALGVTDQHSQVQLYTEGRFDKIVNVIAVRDFRETVTIPAGFPPSAGVNFLGGHTLNELMSVEREGTIVALTEAGRPNVTFELPEVNPFTVGQLLVLLEMQTAYVGELFRINTYDQPGVEAGKIAAFALMGRRGYEARRDEIRRRRRTDPAYII